jgi:hypothetical protein
MTGLIPIWVAQRIYDEFYKQHGGENDSGIQVGFIVPENYTKWAYLAKCCGFCFNHSY